MIDSYGISRSGLDISTKMVAFVPLLVWSFIYNLPWIHIGLCLVLILSGKFGGVPLKKMMGGLSSLFPLMIMMIIFAGFNTKFEKVVNQTVFFQIGENLVITRGGLLLGITFATRLINMVMATRLLLARTSVEDFATLCHRLKLPGAVSLVITTSIRFFPELEKRRIRIIEAQRARGAELEEPGYLRSLFLNVSLMIPLMINGIIMADKLTFGLLIRGVGYDLGTTDNEGVTFSVKDFLVLGVLITLIIAGIGIRIYTPMGVL